MYYPHLPRPNFISILRHQNTGTTLTLIIRYQISRSQYPPPSQQPHLPAFHQHAFLLFLLLLLHPPPPLLSPSFEMPPLTARQYYPPSSPPSSTPQCMTTKEALNWKITAIVLAVLAGIAFLVFILSRLKAFKRVVGEWAAKDG